MDLTLVSEASDPTRDAIDYLAREGIRYVVAPSLRGVRSDFALSPGRGGLDSKILESLWPRRHDAEVLIASRHHRGGQSLSRSFNRLLRRTLHLPFDDITGEVRLYRCSALRRVELPDDRSSASVELLVRLYNEGFKIKEIPLEGLPNTEERIFSQLASLVRLRRLRKSSHAADSDDRAFESRVPLRRRWLARRQETIVSYLEVDVPVLDVGCGSSRLIQALSKGVGLDMSAPKLRFLRGRANAIVAGDLTRLPFRDGSFPQLVCSHVDVGSAYLEELRRILRPHGTLVLGTPDSSSLRFHLLGRLAGLDAGKTSVNERGLRRDLEENGFRVDEIRRLYGAEMIVRAIRR
ncbi:MAG TPA: methyltransferase domain-containing protein [Vicinamibacteria bacterium]|nr:methyltransferase domain-containing protein [Vicinamibacteria bacterium]